jgi:hypothetical protein
MEQKADHGIRNADTSERGFEGQSWLVKMPPHRTSA